MADDQQRPIPPEKPVTLTDNPNPREPINWNEVATIGALILIGLLVLLAVVSAFLGIWLSGLYLWADFLCTVPLAAALAFLVWQWAEEFL